MEFDENSRKPENQEVEREVLEKTETSRGRSFSEVHYAPCGVGFIPKSSSLR